MSGLVTGDTEFHTAGFLLARGDEVVGPDSINDYWQARLLSAGVLTATGDCFTEPRRVHPNRVCNPPLEGAYQNGLYILDGEHMASRSTFQ